MHLVLTGATGLVGSAVLRAMLQDASVSRVTILSRRAVPMAEGHSKAQVILHDDFLSYDAKKDSQLASTLASATGAVWALGISQNKVSSDLYEQITFDYAMAFARFWTGLDSSSSSPSSDAKKETQGQKHPEAKKTLVFVSGEGATHTPGFMTPRFGTVKGRTEMALLELSKESDLTVWAARPGGVDPRQQPDIKDFIPSQGWKLPLMAAMTAVVPGMMSPTKPMAEVLVGLAKNNYAVKGSDDRKEVKVEGGQGKNWRGGVVRNTELRRLGGL